MSESDAIVKKMKSIQSLIVLARLNQVSFDGAQIDHSFGLQGKDAGRDELMLIGKKANLKMKAVRVKGESLYKQPVPCLLGDTQGALSFWPE